MAVYEASKGVSVLGGRIGADDTGAPPARDMCKVTYKEEEKGQDR